MVIELQTRPNLHVPISENMSWEKEDIRGYEFSNISADNNQNLVQNESPQEEFKDRSSAESAETV